MISVCCDFDLGWFLSDVQILEGWDNFLMWVIHKGSGVFKGGEAIFEKIGRGCPKIMSERVGKNFAEVSQSKWIKLCEILARNGVNCINY